MNTLRRSLSEEDTRLSKISKINQTSDVETEYSHLVALPPDKGYGWVIIFACCFANFCIDSVSLSFASIHPNMVANLGLHPGVAASMISVFNAFLYCMGPIASGLVNRFGFRAMMFIGGSLGSLGFFSSYFISNIFGLFCTYSVMSGIGVSLVYMTTMTCPGYWFEKKRMIAMGISSCSTGFSCLLIPIFSDLIVKNLHWSYLFFMESGIFAIATGLSLLLRKPPMAVVELAERSSGVDRHSFISIKNVVPYSKGDPKLSPLSHTGRPLKLSTISVSNNTKKSTVKEMCCKYCCCKGPQKLVTRPLYKEDIFYDSEVSRPLVDKKATPECAMSLVRLPSRRDVLEEQELKCIICPQAITKPLKEMLAFSLLKNKVYILLLCASFCYYFAIFIPFIYLKRTYVSKGMDEKVCTFLVPVLGSGVTTSRLGVGFISMWTEKLHPCHILTAGMTGAGVIYFLMLVYMQTSYLLVMSYFLGIMSGVFVPLRSMLYVEYLGLENLTKAMGLTFTIQAAGSLLGVPFAEIMREKFNDLFAMNYVSGSAFVIGGIFFFLVNIAATSQKKKREADKIIK